MSFPKVAYQNLQSIVGPEYISDDPAVCQAYLRGGEGVGMWDIGRRPPSCTVLPENAEQVQIIIKLANRYKLPFIPISTFMIAFCSPTRPNTIMIDTKRMNKLEIDVKNMYAVVEPYVTYAELQAEIMKYGLFVPPPLCGSQASVLANHLVAGLGQTCHRTGYGSRRILAMEWILPDGELVRTGSEAIPGGGYFWGEGPGPDLRGLVRGMFGPLGGTGFVTKMAVKLFSLPRCEPERKGISPYSTFTLPPDHFAWYVIAYPTPEAAINGMYEIGKAEIAAALMRSPNMWHDLRRAASRQEFWDRWNKTKVEAEKTRLNFIRVCLMGFASSKQLDYEERVLQDIAAETGGNLRRVGQGGAGDFFQFGGAVCAWKATGAFISEKLTVESLDHQLKLLKSALKVKREYIPELLIDDAEEAGWILSYDFCHSGWGEQTSYHDYTPEDLAKAKEFEMKSLKHDLEMHAWPGLQMGWSHSLLGPEMCNYHLLMEKFRNAFDPNGVANPPRFYISEEEKRHDISYPGGPGW
mgnify:CR=1 FL=1